MKVNEQRVKVNKQKVKVNKQKVNRANIESEYSK